MKTRFFLPSLFVVAMGLPSFSQAATLTWDDPNIDNTWSTGASTNWINSTPANVTWSNGSDAVFAGTGETVTVTGTVIPASITFNSAGYNITGGSISLTAPTTINANAAATITSVISGSGMSVVKTAASTLTLAGTNTYSAGTTVSNGTLTLSGIASAGAGTVTLNDANTTASNQLNIGFQSTSSGTTTNAITVANLGTGASSAISFLPAVGATSYYSGPIVFNKGTTLSLPNLTSYMQWFPVMSGSGTLTIGSTKSQRLILAGADGSNSGFSGDIDIQNAAIFEPRSTLSSTTGNSVTVEAGGNLQLRFGSNTSINSLNGAGIVDAWNNPTLLTVGKANGSGSFTGTMKNNGVALSLTKAGTGTETLSGSNITYTGATTVNGGRLILDGTNAFASATTSIATGATLELKSATSGNIASTISGAGALEKTGNGTVNLTGTASLTGATTVTAGTLQFSNASSYPSPVTVNGGGIELSANANLTGGITAKAGTQVKVDPSKAAVMSSLTFGATTGDVSTYQVAPASSYTPVVVTGALTANGGPGSVAVLLASVPTVSGTYHLIQSNSFTGDPAAFQLAGSTRHLLVQQSGSFVDLVVSNDSSYPIWTGANSSEWSTNSIAGGKNWGLSSDASPTNFFNADAALFNDSVTGSTTVDISVANVTPASTTFNNSTHDYTITGTKGVVTGSLTKSGSGKLTIQNTNLFTSVLLNGGILETGAFNQLGGGTMPITIDGGTLRITGASASTVNPLTVAAGGGTLDVSDPASVQTLSVGMTGPGTLIKSGAGALSLSAANAQTGGTVISQGRLTLAGAGTVPGTVTIGDAGTGSNDAIFEVTGNLANNVIVAPHTGGTSTLTYSGTTAGTSATDLNLTLNGDLTFTAPAAGTYLYFGESTLAHGLTITGAGNLIIGDTNTRPVILDKPSNGFSGAVLIKNRGQFEPRTVLNGTAGTNITVETGGRLSLMFEGTVVGSLNGTGGVGLRTGVGSTTGNPLTLGQGNGSGTFSGTMSGMLSLTKIGTGTQVLSGTGIAYSTPTIVTGGTLALDGTTAFVSSLVTVGTGASLQVLNQYDLSSNLNIQAGGTLITDPVNLEYDVLGSRTLSGGGAVTGDLVVTGTLSPGDGVGTLAVSGLFSIGEAATLKWEAGGAWGTASGDKVTCASFDVSADSSFPATIQIAANGVTGFTETARSFILVQGTSPGTNFDPAAFTVDASAFNAATGALGTWQVQQSGNNLVLAYTPGAAPGFVTWAAAKGLTDGNNGPADDPDHDGIPNLVEFYLDGDPLAADASILPATSLDATYLTLVFKRRDDAETDLVSQAIEYGSDLSGWTDVPLGASSSGPDANGVIVTVAENGDDPDTITVQIPRSLANSGKLFGRLKVTR